MVIRAGINKKLGRIANREDPDQTASEEALIRVCTVFPKAFLQDNKCLNI